MVSPWEEYLDALAAFGMRPGLERVEALLTLLGDPQRAFRTVHVVGTNGKSSTTRYVEALLRAHGVRSAAYLSPHLTGYNERVVINGASVSPGELGAAVEEVRAAVDRIPAALGETTQFEVLTVAAFLALARAGVQAAAVEAGLGGRLDATNVVHAPVVVLTNIALEHTAVLGPTREAIFAEKAAVIHGGDAVFGPLEGLEPLAEARCARTGARAHYWGRQVVVQGDPRGFAVELRGAAGKRHYSGLRLPTAAGYQVTNGALAVAAADLLLGGLNEERVRQALATTLVPGRLQVVGDRPLILADGAHNPHGMAALVACLRQLDPPRPRVAVLAMLRDKAVDEMLALVLPLVEQVICTEASEPRSLRAAELAARIRRLPYQPAVEVAASSEAAFRLAARAAGRHGSVLITGSLYLLEDLARQGLLKGEEHAR